MPVFNDMLRIVPTNAPICLNIKNQEYLQKKNKNYWPKWEVEKRVMNRS